MSFIKQLMEMIGVSLDRAIVEQITNALADLGLDVVDIDETEGNSWEETSDRISVTVTSDRDAPTEEQLQNVLGDVFKIGNINEVSRNTYTFEIEKI